MQIWKLSAVPIIKITVSQLQTHPPLPCFVILKMDPVDSFPCQELQVETLPIEAAGGTLEGQSRRQGPPSLVCVLFFHVIVSKLACGVKGALIQAAFTGQQCCLLQVSSPPLGCMFAAAKSCHIVKPELLPWWGKRLGGLFQVSKLLPCSHTLGPKVRYCFLKLKSCNL